MRRLALAPILVCALLGPSTALALGVGDIELQSALNQPLDAEIPLRGVSSETSDDLVVTLASEQAFREVGLERPFSLTRLQFDVASRNGSHYIQVSSHEPITEPFLSFLIEIDSPDGNLLREYTVLLDPPVFASEEGSSDDDGRDRQAASAPREPAGAPGTMADTSDMSGRVADTDTTTSRADTETESSSTSASQQREGQFDDTPMFLQIAREEEAAERRQSEQAAQQRERERQAAAAARDAAQSERTRATGSATRGSDSGRPASTPEDYGPVEEGETLWDIAERLKRDEVTVQQMMLALLRYNPEAFEGDNINRLKQGYVLRVPDADEVRSISAQRAIARVREQNGLWREWRDSLQQGDATRVAAAEDRQGGDGAAGGSADDAQGDQESGRDGSGSSAAGGDDSRLDIVGADEGGATSDETASATASSDSEAQKQLQLAREELASVRSEKEELSERVEQLESTVNKMEQLVTVREEQLAQLERQLAELREQSGDTSTASTDTGSTDEKVARDEEGDTVVADAGGDGGDGGATTPDGSGTSDSGADGGGAEESGAGNSGADTQTSASDQQREVVNPADDTQQQERGWLDAALGFLASIGATISGAVSGLAGGGALSLPVIGGAGVAVLALVLLAVRRRRAAAATDEELMAPVAVDEHHAETEPVGLGAGDSPAAASTASTDTADDNARASLMDEELDLSGLDVDPEAATARGDAEQDDTLVEADTYLAYGLHQQAEDLLRLALEEHPDRLDYREKQLEALSAAGKSEEFVTAAEEFRSRLDDPSGPAWQRVTAMGRKLAPEHALFAAGAIAGDAAASDAGADDDLEFDLGIDSEPAASSAGGGSGDALDSDLGAITGEAAAPELAAGSDESGDLTFDLSDLEDSTPAADSANSEPKERPATAGSDDDGGLDFDLGDLGLDDDAQSSASGGGAADTGSSSSDSDDGGLDLDLGDLGTDDSTDTTASSGGGGGSGSSARDEDEIDLSDFGEIDLSGDSGEKAEETASSTSDAGEIDLSFGLDESESTDFSSSELDDFGLDESALGEPATASGDTSAPSAGGEEDPFAGLDDFGSSDASGGGTDADDFDLSSFEEGFGEADSTQPGPAPAAGNGAMAGADDDLATMLDLAKAYIDMGDAESASHALQEVIAGGTEAQRSEARSLLETVQ